MPSNDWQLGVQWDTRWNNIAWSQPDGPFGLVYPQEITGNSNLFSQEPYNELTGTYPFGCGHTANQCLLQLDYDYDNSVQVMLVCCPICSFLSRVISPATLAFNPIEYAIITP